MGKMKKVATENDEARATLKRTNFKRLAIQRVNRLCKYIEQLSKLSAKGSYTYEPKEIDAIETTLNEAVKNCMSSFRQSGKGTNGFTL
jgi:hypothetical protein